ncbi:PAS domain-containing sensor histidine kinase [Fibrisoma limi]|uniref:PAS domain-containing sensor histidine kinase n=1 Tax=Fibrisoma limi TaxID=663275 RepID=UPI001E2F1AD4|nr:PAS domain-containing sensor histidine kinase [Fibrisoma limi]
MLLAGFGLTILLLTIRHYYETTTYNEVSSGNQSVIQTIAVLNNTIELTLELSYPADDELTDTTAQAIYRNNRSARNTAAIRPLIDSLVALTSHTPELYPLARRLQAESETILQANISRQDNANKQIQRLVRSLRTFRLALADSLLDDQERIREQITTVRTLDAVIDGLVLLLALALLYVFYRYTLRRERLTKIALERQKELTQYLEAIPEGVAVLNTDQQIVYVNQAGHALLKTSTEHIPVLLSDWADRFRLSHADTKKALESADLPLNQALKGKAVGTDNLLLETEGETRFLATHARPLYNREGDIVGAISIFRDITEARQKEQELQRARTVAEQSLREREIFLANISHDVRTPLNAILGFSELISQKQLPPEEQEYLDNIKLSGNNVLALINELLDISSLESGQLTLQPEPININELIQAVEVDLGAKATGKGLRYEVQVAPAVPVVLVADPIRLVQILLNLGSNAVKFTKEGFVKLTVYAEASNRPGHVNLVFRMEDSGVGFPENDLDRIFNRFSQISSDTLFRSAGTGLGLNIAKSLVALMNGTIDVQSRVGQGTTFTVTIPFGVPDSGAVPVRSGNPLVFLNPSIPAPEATPDRSLMRILIVEDNEMNQKVLEGFLMRFKLKPTKANNGLEAVEILKQQQFDLILMDIQMPEMDGYTATQTIRQQLSITTPIVAMTAYTMPGERERCLAVGMNEYLTKPLRIEQIGEVISRFAPVQLAQVVHNKLSAEVESEQELVNLKYLTEVTDDDAELLAELVALFVGDLPQFREKLFVAVDENDRPAFNQATHKFRSSLNSLAMLSIAARLKAFEGESVPFDSTMKDKLTALFDDINRSLSILEKKLDGNVTDL